VRIPTSSSTIQAVSTHLTNAAKDLEAHLKRFVSFYMTVGWMKEDKPVLMVYWDLRHQLPDKVIPTMWQGYEVREQAVMPPGARPKEMPNLPWII
jgi:hypothetical protein